MSKDTVVGQKHRQDGGMAIMDTGRRCLLRITPGPETLAIIDAEAVVSGSRETGYRVTARFMPWIDAIGQRSSWTSHPDGQLILGDRGLHVSTQDLIEACMAASDRTVRVADLPQLTT